MKLKARNKCGQADVPLRSVLGMAGWHPVSGVERALEFHKYDLKSGAPSEMLSSIHHGSEKESTDATVNDPKGLQHVLKYIAEPFKNKARCFLNLQDFGSEHVARLQALSQINSVSIEL